IDRLRARGPGSVEPAHHRGEPRPAPRAGRGHRAPARGARHRHGAELPGRRSAGWRPLPLAGTAKLRRARPPDAAGAHLPGASPGAQRARLRLLLMRRKRIITAPALEPDPLWYRDAIIYELRVGAFQDSDGDGVGDFRGLTERLDYLERLGVTAL